MTGIRIVNNTVISLYETFILCGIAGFAAYDLEKRRVPDRALAFFCLAALPAPFVHAWPFTGWPIWFLYSLSSVMGAAVAFRVKCKNFSHKLQKRAFKRYFIPS